MPLVASAVMVLAVAQLPAEAKGGGNPHTTTTTATTAPRAATMLIVDPAAAWATYGCGFDYCGFSAYTAALSARLSTLDGLPVGGRVVHLSTGGGACDGLTDPAGVAVCTAQTWQGFGGVYGSFFGDTEYGPSSNSSLL